MCTSFKESHLFITKSWLHERHVKTEALMLHFFPLIIWLAVSYVKAPFIKLQYIIHPQIAKICMCGVKFIAIHIL